MNTQEIIDELIDHIDKAILKNSVSNRQVAAVLAFLNERLQQLSSLDIEKLREYFIRKDAPDSTSFLLRLLGGAQFGHYRPGFMGTGGLFNENGHLEADTAFFRRKLIVPEIVFNSISVILGDKWRAPGGGVIQAIDTETRIVDLELQDGQIGAVAVGDICMGIFHSLDSTENAIVDSDDSRGNRTYAGFFTTYFTVTEVIGERNQQFKYQLRPESERWPNSFHPCELMHFVAYGNFTNPDRQTSVYETRTYTRMLWKQNTWEIGAHNIAQQLGDLSNMQVHGIDMTGYSAYLNSVYMTGSINQIKPDGSVAPIPNFLPDWKPGDKVNFYDEVSYNGGRWLCVNEDGTDTTPGADNPAWFQTVAPGKDGASIANHGNWHTGLLVPYMGIVRMGQGSWMCTNKAGTNNPPMWTVTDKDGNRILQTQDGGQTWGYILTGEINSAEYEIIAWDGTDGVPGKPGADAKVLYMWTRYADDAEGNGMSNDPTGKKFLGLATNKETPIESDNPADYTWAEFAGRDGVSIKGDDGKTLYTWVAYSDNADGSGMYQVPTAATKYIGLSPNQETAKESNNPADYVWSKFRGDDGQDGDSVVSLGQWKTGLTVPYLGTVRMGWATWMCINKASTNNPPLWTVTDQAGNRILQTQDGGQTWGYILTGEKNSAEYELVAEDGSDGKDGVNGKDGEDGTNGDPGIQGCIIRKAEWKAGVEFRNDEALTSGTRYLDVALVRNDSLTTGWQAYKCLKTHTSSAANAPGNAEHWEPFGLNVNAIFTSLIIAKDAEIEFIQGNQLLIKDARGNVTGGISGEGYMWMGGPSPYNAMSVDRADGSGHRAGGKISWDEFGNPTIEGDFIGKITTRKNGVRIVIDPSTNSFKMYNANGLEVVKIAFMNEGSLAGIRFCDYSGSTLIRESKIVGSSLSLYTQATQTGTGKDLEVLIDPGGIRFSENGVVTRTYGRT